MWSTRVVEASSALDYWRSARRAAYVDVATTPYEPGFVGEISYARYGDFALSVKRASGERVDRSPALIARGNEECEYLYVVLPNEGVGRVAQAGNTADIRPGWAVIYDSAQPFSLDYPEHYEQVVLHVPVEQALAAGGLRLGSDLFGVPIAIDGALVAVSAFFRNLAVAQVDDPQVAALLAPHAVSLATALLTYAARTRAGDDIPLVLQREQVLAYMHAHLGDPNLDVDQVAAGCHVSRRTVHRMFEDTGQTAMSHLRAMRVEAAQHLLTNQPGLSVESVAREVGFASDTHFYRAFRAIAGTTPGDYRQSARRQAAALRSRTERPGMQVGQQI